MFTARTLSASLALALAPVIAAADDLPKRKPGLWEIRNEIDGESTPMGAIQTCIDDKTDNLVQESMNNGPYKCDEIAWRKDGDAYRLRSVCKLTKSVATTEGVFTGKFDSAYSGELRIAYAPPLFGIGTSVMKIDAKWLGPCKEGQKPGDVVMPNMPGGPKSFNAEDMKKALERRKGAPR